MKFGVLIFPGSNCDHDMIYVLRDILNQEVVELWHKDTDLQDCDAIAVPGGFTYGDYLRSGALARFSPIMKKVVEFAHNGGLVFGVCNGFQILCEAGLLPGTLLHNENQKFICKNQYIKVENTDTAMTMFVDKDKALKIPIAHGQGRYYAPDSTLQEMLQNGQIVWRYCDEDGKLNQKANPNGSVMNIAGVCNVEKNVFGMMPHPERAADPELKNTHGLIIFKSMIEYFNEQKMLGKKEMN
ncbi:MAG TPA: phosphoribosylformylglycinamidine synthase subunit PurQ [Bacteroidales bacterium]|jgi:phosphoribosylformylglycinamidine synthase|nr:phosphoribosylformylglycinamidine synthase subunit PurQ [Bacteroidales bacterium]HOE39219.1 phosphoribosylformylglycinamidine synthase subunit PurQ [Bacteroidales bacterium]HOR60867.1 phosphoribosylformylglycinamidine synthase subunit PurQ [Bacteroidales bacterium]HPL05090.1 phosphoribosylformylglycinamidine synthase subunit PurQ [Bacteroidales bacterium]HPX75463.1 phosphoribosylformylglycinamidine synthase subunit PurQ [Bacteroidales bacterium]